MLKVFIGIGILATPASFANIGIVGGCVGMILIGIVATYTMQLQIAACEKCNEPIGNYSELGQAILGDSGKKFVDFCILASQSGFAIAYLIFIGQQMDQVICFETLYEQCNIKGLYIFIAAFILIPICWLRSFKPLAYVSMASNIFLIFARKYTLNRDNPLPFYIVFVIVGYCFKNHNEHPELSENLTYFQFSAIPLFFGIAVFDFEGNGVVINLHASMKEPEKFNMVLKTCLSIYVAILCIFSTIAYWVSTKGIIIDVD